MKGVGNTLHARLLTITQQDAIDMDRGEDIATQHIKSHHGQRKAGIH